MAACEISLEEAVRLLLSVEKPVILMHARPDGDAAGTAAALTEVYRQLGRDAKVMCADALPPRLAFLGKGLSFTDSLAGRTPVSVDVAAPSQLGTLADLTEGGEAVVLSIDHHASGTLFAPTYRRADASAAAEVLFDLVSVLIEEGYVTLNETLAACLYAAVSSDTGCFAYSNAGARTHRIAAEWIDTGIDFAEINHLLFASKSLSQIAAEGLAAEKIRTAFDGSVAYTVISKAERDARGLVKSDFETAIDVVRSVMGAQIAFTVREDDDGSYRVSLRSVGADVAKVAAVFGGGGHIRASGCSVNAEGADGAAKAVLDAIAACGVL